MLRLTAIVARPDGSEVLREQQSGSDPVALGEQVGDALLRRGATQILEHVYGAGAAGAAAAIAHDMNTTLPLAGCRVLVSRAKKQAGALSSALRELGCQVIEIPFIEIRRPSSYRPLDSALAKSCNLRLAHSHQRQRSEGALRAHGEEAPGCIRACPSQDRGDRAGNQERHRAARLAGDGDAEGVRGRVGGRGAASPGKRQARAAGARESCPRRYSARTAQSGRSGRCGGSVRNRCAEGLGEAPARRSLQREKDRTPSPSRVPRRCGISCACSGLRSARAVLKKPASASWRAHRIHRAGDVGYAARIRAAGGHRSPASTRFRGWWRRSWRNGSASEALKASQDKRQRTDLRFGGRSAKLLRFSASSDVAC